MSSLVDSEELIRSDVLDCRQADQSAERLSAALATRVLGHRPIHGAGVTRVTERASWAFLGGYSAGITLGELIHGAPSTVLPHYVDALRTSYARVLPEDASQAPFINQEDSVVHLFGLHEPVFAVLFVVTDSVVCSAVVGGHDVSWPAGGVVPGASYVRFTDDPELETWGVWSNRPLEFFGGTAVRSARWVKTHPHMLFPDARWVVWVDGNVIPLTGLEGLLAEFKASGAPVGAISHPTRSTVAQEIVECVKRGKDSAEVLYAVEERLGGDPGVGLWETNVLFFDLQHPQLRPLLTKWWSLIEGGSHRDQVSLPYAVAATGVRVYPILPRGESTRSDGRFALIHHGEQAFINAARLLQSAKEAGQIGTGTGLIVARRTNRANDPVLEGAGR